VARNVGGTHEFDECLVAVGSDAAFGVDDLAEGGPQLNQLLRGAVPRQVPQVEHLRRRLRVPELRLPTGSHPSRILSSKPAALTAVSNPHPDEAFPSKRKALVSTGEYLARSSPCEWREAAAAAAAARRQAGAEEDGLDSGTYRVRSIV